MIDTPKRARGRPKGSEIDDGIALLQIADFLVEGRAGNVAAAVRLLAGHEPSLIRRLQRKFHRDRDALIAAAHARSEALALQDGIRQGQFQRVTQPLSWRQAHDATTQLLDAVNLERQDALSKSFVRR